MSPVRYDLAVASWKSSEILVIVSHSGKPIAYFPLDFILKGGHPEWAYVIKAIQQITDEVAGTQWSLMEENGQPISMEETPRSGRYMYASKGVLYKLPNNHRNQIRMLTRRCARTIICPGS